jgi:hypothetical protein
VGKEMRFAFPRQSVAFCSREGGTRTADLLITCDNKLLQGFAQDCNFGVDKRFFFYGLLCVASYCVRNGVKVVSRALVLRVAGSFANHMHSTHLWNLGLRPIQIYQTVSRRGCLGN